MGVGTFHTTMDGNRNDVIAHHARDGGIGVATIADPEAAINNGRLPSSSDTVIAAR
jgi:hypothetical protein